MSGNRVATFIGDGGRGHILLLLLTTLELAVAELEGMVELGSALDETSLLEAVDEAVDETAEELETTNSLV